MNKIEELIDSIWDFDGYSTPDIRRIMKEYAEIYAEKCLQFAYNTHFDGSSPDDYWFVDEEQFFNITLPPHE